MHLPSVRERGSIMTLMERLEQIFIQAKLGRMAQYR